MARALRIQYAGAYYHVTCRGNARKDIFADDKDRKRFLTLLKETRESYQTVLHAYVLMDNHFHLLVQTPLADLAEFMRCFNIRYTAWFNRRHNRCGHLYQGRYHARLIDADAYLLEVSRYLHLNPARVSRLRSADNRQRWRHLMGHRWSSLPGYLDERRAEEGVTYGQVLSSADGRSGYRRFVLDGLKRGVDSPFLESGDRTVLGDETFVQWVRDKYVGPGSKREQPGYRALMTARLDPEMIIKVVAEALGLDRSELLSRTAGGVARGILCDLLQRYGGLKGVAAGNLLGGLHYSAVSQLRRRLKSRMATDERTARQYKTAEARLKEPLSNVKI